MPEPLPLIWLCLAALAAGAINSLAGGGTLLTFPTLIAVLAPSLGTAEAKVIANATSTVALVTGSVAGAWGYRIEVREVRRWLLVLIWPSLFGGVLGALFLTRADPAYFAALVPWLVMVATLLFLAEPLLPRSSSSNPTVRRDAEPAEPSAVREGAPLCVAAHQGLTDFLPVVSLMIFQLMLAIYGGYFGAGIGILMIAGLTLMGVGHIHQINALKTILAACINSVAVAVFVIDGKVYWSYALPMGVAAIIGGYVGARWALRIPRQLVRWLVIAIGFGLTAFFFAAE
jgi:uncharacterized membrane protein YfcA